MTNPIPTIGSIVHYTLSEDDAKRINKRRDDAIATAHANKLHPEETGKQVHIGNRATAGEVYPMLIVRVWGDSPESAVNGQVLLDGNDTLWVTSVTAGEGGRRFSWPGLPAAQPASLEAAWRKAIADQVRRNCTLDWDRMQKGGDHIVYGVADWIENPPEWSTFEAPSV